MSNLSLVIRNARIVDGSGRPSYVADVGIAGDKIARIGRIDEQDVPAIDAGGQVLAPGFIEIHTHYDPQLCWDRLASPALEHGFTTVVIGNCSLTLAPIRDKAQGDMISRLFQKIEDIGLKFFDNAVPYSWRSFGEFLDFIKPGLGPNVGALVGHTALRHFVMGDDARTRVATDEEIAEMCKLLGEAIDAGAMGFSMSYADADENNQLVASYYSDLREKVALAKTVTDHGRRFVQTVRDFADPELQLRNLEELGEISLASGALCSALLVMDMPQFPGHWRKDLAKLEELQQKGARVFAQTTPRSFDVSFQMSKSYFTFYILPTWSEFMSKPVPERIAKLKDPSLRQKLSEEVMSWHGIFAGTHVVTAVSPENKKYEGRRVEDIAIEEGKTLSDAMIDIALADNLETMFQTRGVIHANLENVTEIMAHPLIQIGNSDSGAHLAQFAGAGDSCYMMEHYVRKHGKFTIERAVQRMTSEVAQDLGMAGRGLIELGYFADLVIFDPETITRGEEVVVDDLPGGGPRYVRHPKGIGKVIVNGQVVVDNGVYTDARPGRIV